MCLTLYSMDSIICNFIKTIKNPDYLNQGIILLLLFERIWISI